jgi:hypothetical protein
MVNGSMPFMVRDILQLSDSADVNRQPCEGSPDFIPQTPVLASGLQQAARITFIFCITDNRNPETGNQKKQLVLVLTDRNL